MTNRENFNDRSPRGLGSPCLNCPERKVMCHAYCEKYKEYCVKNAELREKEKEESKLRRMESEIKYENLVKSRKF